MSPVILGASECGICGLPILVGDAISSFPAFVSNQADPLHFFSDRGFHQNCFEAHPLAAQARERLRALRELVGNRRCIVCGKTIVSPDDYFSFGFLGETPESVRKLNFLQFHRQHLRDWQGITAAQQALVDLEHSGAWQGPALRWLIEQIAKAVPPQSRS